MIKLSFATSFILLSIWLANPAVATDAATIYANRCAFCHGATGKGDGPAGVALKPAPRNLADPQYWKAADREGLKAIIANGKPGTAMVAFKDTLTPDEIAELVEHLESFNPER